LDFLLGHLIVSRGESKRLATLPDLGLLDCDAREGPAPCKAVVLIMNQGKTINGKIEYGGMIRHKSVQCCGVGALALYFFSRYHIEGVPFIDFKQKSNWYIYIAEITGITFHYFQGESL
jgi:hypothetical protein